MKQVSGSVYREDIENILNALIEVGDEAIRPAMPGVWGQGWWSGYHCGLFAAARALGCALGVEVEVDGRVINVTPVNRETPG